MSRHREEIKRDWATAPYYDLAEQNLWPFWSDDRPFRRLFHTLDRSDLVELACGHGRHAAHISRNYQIGRLTLVDINEQNIAFCRGRFAGDGRFAYVVNSGGDLAALSSGGYGAIFCYDAMVHFEYDDVIAYLAESHRILREGGRALLHHSNYDGTPGARYSDNPHWRNFMSARLFAHAAMRSGFKVVEQSLLDWAGVTNLDCVTLLEKPERP